MGWEAWFLFGLIGIAIVLFVSEKISFDVTAIFITISLMLSGIVSIEEGLSGFSNEAAITILGLLILNNGLEHTGVIQVITDKLIQITGSSMWSVLLVILPFAAFLSAFTNNTVVLAMFLPILIGLGSKKKISPSKLLMPLAFVSILGGLCTIIGTSTNLLINSVARQYGIEPFGFFEFSYIGIVLVGLGIVYSLLIGYKLIPERIRATNPEDEFEIKEYLTELKVTKDSNIVGNYYSIKDKLSEKGLELIRIIAGNGREMIPKYYHSIRPGNRLLMKGALDNIVKVQEDKDFEKVVEQEIREDKADDRSQGTMLVEALVSPQSSLINRKLSSINFSVRYDSIPLAVNRMGKKQITNIGDISLRVGDTLLLEASPTITESSFAHDDLILLNTIPKVGSVQKQILSLLIVILVVGLAASGIVSIVVGALTGVVAMAITGCIDTAQVYKQIEWKIYFLIAGLIPLGIALQNTGMDKSLASSFIDLTSSMEIFPTILVLFFVTVILTNVLANNATALLMAPIAVSIANQLNIDPHALLLTVMIGASVAFFTPFGYHTLTLIYVPGKYKFKDYIIAGLPLTIFTGIVASWMIWKIYI